MSAPEDQPDRPADDGADTAASPRPNKAGRQRHPRWLALVLEELMRLRSAESDTLAQALRARTEFSLEPGIRAAPLGTRGLDELRRELQRLGWVEYHEHRWSLTAEGTALAQSRPTENLFRFARALCLAGERAHDGLVSGLLARLWQLSPEMQGAVLLPSPRLGQVPGHADELRAWLRPVLLSQLDRLVSHARGLELPSSQAEIVDRVSMELPARWEELGGYRRREYVRRMIEERTLDWLFGGIAHPAELKSWQTRMDLAGLTLVARRLPGAQGKVWFPVGAFRESAGPAFVPVPELAHEGQTWYCHEPAGPEAEAALADSLFAAYKDVQRQEGTEYVSLAAVRDMVCYQLRIAHERFQTLLQQAFPRMLQGELPYMISLEVDVTPQEKMRTVGSLPIVIDHIPRFIITMGRRQATD